MAELYGYLDADTGDWVDGLFANIFREMNRPIEQEVRIPRICCTFFHFFFCFSFFVSTF